MYSFIVIVYSNCTVYTILLDFVCFHLHIICSFVVVVVVLLLWIWFSVYSTIIYFSLVCFLSLCPSCIHYSIQLWCTSLFFLLLLCTVHLHCCTFIIIIKYNNKNKGSHSTQTTDTVLRVATGTQTPRGVLQVVPYDYYYSVPLRTGTCYIRDIFVLFVQDYCAL